MIERLEVPFGKEKIIFETGKIAKQAGGAVTITCGGTVVLATVVMSKEPRVGIDFFPLTVEYKERTYAAGRIPGGFFKREGRPTETEILNSRLIDRPIRPMFPDGLYNEVQIMVIVLSSDGQNDPDVLAMLGSSCALALSDIPFTGPIGAVKIAQVEGNFVVNPTYAQVAASPFEIVIAGTRKGITMIESGAKQVPEKLMVDAMRFGYDHILELIRVQEEFAKRCGKKKADVALSQDPVDLIEKVKAKASTRLAQVYAIGQKEQREEQLDIIAKDLISALSAEGSPYTAADVKAALVKVEKEQVRKMIIEKKRRVDGRSFTDIRQITCEVGLLPRTHGSALFTRGQTQSLSVTTLGTSDDAQTVEQLTGESSKVFMLHYNFPPFSVGEARPLRGTSRREIGHGALAERALATIIPGKEEFPYTVRVVSEIMESNGSSSMATVCASTLALMDAGVPIKAPISGIAMGLVKEGDQVAVLTDIMGVEDHFGDMDFKVTGSKEGVTAIQLDLKIDGISFAVLEAALTQAKEARLIILEKMLAVMAKPRPDISPYAPRIMTLKINPERIKDVIGPGGKMIKRIIAETGVTIDVEDDGSVAVASIDAAAMQRAIDWIKGITEEAEVGKIYKGKITRLMNFGAFCEFMPGKEGLIHVSELASRFVKNVEEVVKVGDEVQVKVIEIDNLNRVNLSIKKALPEQKTDSAS